MLTHAQANVSVCLSITPPPPPAGWSSAWKGEKQEPGWEALILLPPGLLGLWRCAAGLGLCYQHRGHLSPGHGTQPWGRRGNPRRQECFPTLAPSPLTGPLASLFFKQRTPYKDGGLFCCLFLV